MTTEDRLKKHQLAGVEWMWERVQRRKGCILGDEMGMGKTVQILSLLERAWNAEKKSVLILVPTTLLQVWSNEAKKFDLGMSFVCVHSEHKNTTRILKEADGKYAVLMGYEQALKKEKLIRRMYFDVLVMDEAQRVKNRKSRVSALCKNIDAGSKVCVTGTPIQNNLSELWTVVDMVQPNLLGDSGRFKAEIEDPLRRSKLKRATEEEKRKGEAISKHLHAIVSEVLLRRTKEEVCLVLPEKKEAVVFCPLTETQQRLYLEALQEDQVVSTVQGKTNPLKTIWYLRRICSHPFLHGSKSKSGRKRGAPEEKALLQDSGKVRVLLQLVAHWKTQRRKILVFSQYREVLDILERVLKRLNVQRIDGALSVRKRAEVLETFGRTEETEVLLLTTKVGGVGINIPRANTVVLYDMDWNPFNDDQAQARAHRIGQTQTVEVFRLTCKGTIEDSVRTCQGIKKEIARGVLKGEDKRKLFDKVDLCRLFHYSHDPEDVTDVQACIASMDRASVSYAVCANSTPS
ncbi:DNA excision repair protein ERCC-6 [Nematocida sp. AWRm77]|nr:DNA excision repair protein ERCC-6 [Nematocida sp. AWRm77]